MALRIAVFDVEDIGNSQYRCSYRITDQASDQTLESGEGYAVMKGARHGLGPKLWALIEARQFEGAIKPFVPPTE